MTNENAIRFLNQAVTQNHHKGKDHQATRLTQNPRRAVSTDTAAGVLNPTYKHTRPLVFTV